MLCIKTMFQYYMNTCDLISDILIHVCNDNANYHLDILNVVVITGTARNAAVSCSFV